VIINPIIARLCLPVGNTDNVVGLAAANAER
jgi:hypothetical protein